MPVIQEIKSFRSAHRRRPTRCGHGETIEKCGVTSSLGNTAERLSYRNRVGLNANDTL
jgi:hypothetical protein